MEPEQLKIKVNDEDTVTAMIYRGGKSRADVTLVLGHGAGGNQLSGFMRLFAGGLAARGIDTVTFNFIYSEKGRGAPDQKPKLEACYQAVIDAVSKHKTLAKNRLVIGGKSMGGRIASQVAAGWSAKVEMPVSQRTGNGRKSAGSKKPEGVSTVAGLVFLGYPLHPPGRPEQLRDKHLVDVKAPMLLVQGTRDAFGSPDELREVIKRLHLPAKLHLIEGGDHSFKVPKSAGPQDQVYEAIMDVVSGWITKKLS